MVSLNSDRDLDIIMIPKPASFFLFPFLFYFVLFSVIKNIALHNTHAGTQQALLFIFIFYCIFFIIRPTIH